MKTPIDVKTANVETAEEELKKATQIDMKEYNDLPINASQKTDQLERPKSGKTLKKN